MIRIPLIDVPSGQEPALVSAEAEPARLALLVSGARRTYTPVGMAAADSLSRAWSQRQAGPYAAAVGSVDRMMVGRGAYLLNHSYEWGCTSGALESERGPVLLRTLDWPFDGLGRALVVTRWDGGAGPYLSVTWPGVVGVITGSAPGRFAAAINQPPLPLPGWGRAIGWPAARVRVARSRALSPTHLLRMAFDTCANFDGAVALLRNTPVCLPVIYTLAGTLPHQAIVIERTPDRAYHPVEPVAANHWASTPGPAGRPRNATSLARRAAMAGRQAPAWDLEWVKDPILVADTRLACIASPATGAMLVEGWESTGRVTEMLAC